LIIAISPEWNISREPAVFMERQDWIPAKTHKLCFRAVKSLQSIGLF
jgi:hypothetical protein